MLEIPMTLEQVKKRGWSELDIILVTGDGFVDHPSFGTAVIARVLEADGFKVGVIAQPDWKSLDDIMSLGRPKLFFGVTAGNVDSMVANYTASKKRRKSDDYTPGGLGGSRPDRATIIYSNLIRRAYKDTRIVLGGIEASLRRFAHYDWWANKVRKSVLVDSKADLLVYGMGEKPIVSIARSLKETGEIPQNVKGTVYWTSNVPSEGDEIYSFDEISNDKSKYMKAFMDFYRETDAVRGRTLFQKQDNRYVVQNPPQLLKTSELDEIYALPFTRKAHSIYSSQGKIKAEETTKYSITTHRGCYGECNFCAITLHQGRYVVSRTEESIISEVGRLVREEDFHGTVTDVGGPTANMYGFECAKKFKLGACKDKRCLSPTVCPSLRVNHTRYLNLLKKIKVMEGVKHVFVASGIRYDLIMADNKAGREFIRALVKNHVSGQMKIAPEHTDPEVLNLMGKPAGGVLDDFIKEFKHAQENEKRYLIGYFIAAHPGSTLESMKRLKLYIKNKLGYNPQQIQIFTPTPSTVSTAMYYTELHPYTGKKIFVEKDGKNRELQKTVLLKEKEAGSKKWEKRSIPTKFRK